MRNIQFEIASVGTAANLKYWADQLKRPDGASAALDPAASIICGGRAGHSGLSLCQDRYFAYHSCANDFQTSLSFGEHEEQLAVKSPAHDPVFPLTVIFAGGERLSVDSVNDAECNLEWLDTEDNGEPVTVVDRLGRPVHLKIEALRIVRCELKDGACRSSLLF